MVIDIAILPPSVQQQILEIKQGEVVQFAQNGELVAVLSKPTLIGDDEVFGLFKHNPIDGLDYERQIRSEWD